MACFILPALLPVPSANYHNPNRTILLFFYLQYVTSILKQSLFVVIYVLVNVVIKFLNFNVSRKNFIRGGENLQIIEALSLFPFINNHCWIRSSWNSIPKRWKQNLNQNKACFEGLACSQQLVRLNMHFNPCLTFKKNVTFVFSWTAENILAKITESICAILYPFTCSDIYEVFSPVILKKSKCVHTATYW